MAGHPRSSNYRPGDHWVECPRCHFDWRSSDMRKEWTGLWVCRRCWEPRHPGDFVRGVPDDTNPPKPVYPPQEEDVGVSKPDDRIPDVPGATYGTYKQASGEDGQWVTLDFEAQSTGSYTDSSFSALFADVTFTNPVGDGFDLNSTTNSGFVQSVAVTNDSFSSAGSKTKASFSGVVTDVKVSMGDAGEDVDDLFLYAYDSNGAVVDSDTVTLSSGTADAKALSVSHSGISRVEFWGEGATNNSVLWSDFSYFIL